ncbi:MAG: carbohydrate-binding domain-containing protein [Bacteroidales bacterium]|nr:carbohydrate-binding domain-containing protein [Candidatus Liminaster caballi]
MNRNHTLIISVAVLIMSALLSACEKYNTDVMGTAFAPANSLVSRFVNAVYVEYREGGVRIWGRNTGLVDYDADGARLTLTVRDDSLAIIAYGNAVGDSINPYDGQLRILSDRDFALYVNGLYLHSAQGSAIEVQSEDNTCYLVVSSNSKNYLSDTLYTTQYADGHILEADGCVFCSGPLIFDGRGLLNVRNCALPRWDDDMHDSIYTHAIYARGGVICNYAMTAELTSVSGNAIHTSGTDVKLVRGEWKLNSGREAIDAEGADVSIGEEAKLYIGDSLYTSYGEPDTLGYVPDPVSFLP